MRPASPEASATSSAQVWLEWACLAFAGVGLMVAVAGGTAAFAVYRAEIARVFFGSSQLPAPAADLASFLFVPLGGAIVGKWVAAAYLARLGIRRGDRWGYLASWVGLLSWFSVDSAVSLYLGACSAWAWPSSAWTWPWAKGAPCGRLGIERWPCGSTEQRSCRPRPPG